MSEPAPATPVPCANCLYKATAGQMVDPCFPCLLDRCLFSGKPKAQYDHWRHESTPWEQVRREQEELHASFKSALEANPDLAAELERLFGPTR